MYKNKTSCKIFEQLLKKRVGPTVNKNYFQS